MAERDEILKEKIEHSGLFDFPRLYSFAHSWLTEKEYGVNEEEYSEKVDGDKRNIDIKWKATRKVSDYFKIELKIGFEIKDLEEVNVEINGAKDKMNKGRMEIKMQGILVKDHESKWDISPFYRFLRDVYNKFIIPSRVNAIEKIVSEELRGLKEEIKAFLNTIGKR